MIVPYVQEQEAAVDWRLYADRSRFSNVPRERFFVLQGAIRRREGKVLGADWHVFLESG